MRIAGIIAEYDPFHSGHAAHIAATRRPDGGGATHVVTVLSGSFTQRGEPAMLTKFRRAEMALAGGADLVLELPLPWSMAPAERFAAGGVALLHALGCVEVLSFGSECGEVHRLQKLAALPQSPAYRETLRQVLSTGVPYAAAHQTAAAVLLGEDTAALLASPNNTLGLEYIRAATAQKADFDYFTLERQGALHTDTSPKQGFASGTLLRDMAKNGQLADMTAYIPEAVCHLLTEAINGGQAPAHPPKLEYALLAQLRRMTPEQMTDLPYLSEGLENRLNRAVRTAGSLEELLTAVKTKRYPLSRIRRILWAALVGMTTADAQGLPPYIRVLGMNQRGQEILATAHPTLPLLTRSSQLAQLSEQAQRVFRLEEVATDLHALTLPVPQPSGTDRTTKLIVTN